MPQGVATVGHQMSLGIGSGGQKMPLGIHCGCCDITSVQNACSHCTIYSLISWRLAYDLNRLLTSLRFLSSQFFLYDFSSPIFN